MRHFAALPNRPFPSTLTLPYPFLYPGSASPRLASVEDSTKEVLPHLQPSCAGRLGILVPLALTGQLYPQRLPLQAVS